MTEKPYYRIQWRRRLYYPALVAVGFLLVYQTREFFSYAGQRWVYMLALSASLSFSLTPLCSRIAHKFGVLDAPDLRKTHAAATPLLGGVAVIVSFLLSIVLNGIYSPELLGILVGSMVLFVVGAMDDIREISARIKLIIQLACTFIVIASGIQLRVIPDNLDFLARAGNLILTCFWIVGITNAMNFFDGMDGLAAGLGAIIAFFLGVVAFQTFQPILGWVAVAAMGSCLGFLPYNFRLKGNASIFLGDAGSTTLGFLLACISVYGEWNIDNTIAAVIAPLLIFWVLIFDMTYITVDRIATGKVKTFRQWIDYVGRDHLHHRLAEVLGDNKKSVLTIYLITICLGTGAVVLRNARSIDAILLVVQAIIVVMLITILERRGRTLIRESDKKKKGPPNQ